MTHYVTRTFQDTTQRTAASWGYSQKQLAFALEMHPTLLNNNLSVRNYATLTYDEVKHLIKILVKWRTTTPQVLAQLLEWPATGALLANPG